MLTRRTRLVGASATAACAASGLLFAAPAQARECLWQLQPTVILIQDNNLRAEFGTNDNQMTGSARYAHVGGNDWTNGTASGGLSADQRTLNISVRWTDGPGAGLSNDYSGSLDKNGRITGTTTNNVGTVNGWTAQYSALCKEPPQPDLEVTPGEPLPGANPKPQDPKPQNPQVNGATINGDVDVYSQPGGVGDPAGNLKKGTIVVIEEWRDDNWVKLLNKGWVWGDFVTKN